MATPALVLAHQLERCLVGLGAGVLEQDLTRAGVDQPIEGFGDGRLMLVGEQVRRVGERARLGRNGLGDRRVGMTEAGDGETAQEVEWRVPLAS